MLAILEKIKQNRIMLTDRIFVKNINILLEDKKDRIEKNNYQNNKEFLEWEIKIKDELIAEVMSDFDKKHKLEDMQKLYIILKNYEKWRKR